MQVDQTRLITSSMPFAGRHLSRKGAALRAAVLAGWAAAAGRPVEPMASMFTLLHSLLLLSSTGCGDIINVDRAGSAVSSTLLWDHTGITGMLEERHPRGQTRAHHKEKRRKERKRTVSD